MYSCKTIRAAHQSLTTELTSDRKTARCSTWRKAYLENKENSIRLHHITKHGGIRGGLAMELKYSLQMKMEGLPSQNKLFYYFTHDMFRPR
jgi:hypothetical protein